jgi:hypothetical protein
MIDGKPRFSVLIYQHWMKGKKLTKDELYVVHPITISLMFSSLRNLLKEGDELWANSMFEFLAQASADEAFRDYSTIDDVLDITADPQELIRIYWKDDVLDKPLLRNRNGKSFSLDNYNHLLAGYTKEEGYERLTSYSIRRYVANELASRSFG